MKPRRLFAVLAGVGGIAAVAAVAYPGLPGGGGSAPPAAADTAVYGICNVSVSDIPDGVNVSHLPLPRPPGFENTPTGSSIYLMLSIPLPPDHPRTTPNPGTGIDPNPGQSRVFIDAATGEVAFENYLSDTDESLLKTALSSLQIGPWLPDYDAWPRTDSAPKEGIRKDDDSVTKIQFRPPDSGSGLMLGLPQGDTHSRLLVYTCDSVVEIDGATGEILRQEITVAEQALFNRFLEEVKVP